MRLKIDHATAKQILYIEQLLIDLGADTRIKRLATLEQIIEKPINYLDELTITEARRVIEKLKEYKDVR